MTTPVEAKPSVQGLADWLRLESRKLDKSWPQIHALNAWASAVESLEASRIAHEGQAQPLTAADLSEAASASSRHMPGTSNWAYSMLAHLGKRIAAPQAVPAQAEMTDAEIDAVLLQCSTTGKRQVWFTRQEAKCIALAATRAYLKGETP